mgnify:CR=1 FL=1
MKKLIAMLLALVMLLALCACGQTAAPAEQSTAAPAEEPAAEPVEEPTDDVGEPVNLRCPRRGSEGLQGDPRVHLRRQHDR